MTRIARRHSPIGPAPPPAAAYDSYAEVVAAPDLDIVYVGTITRLHKEHSLLAVEAGKHVLCEKPLAVDASDAAEMCAAAKAQGVCSRKSTRRGSVGDPPIRALLSWRSGLTERHRSKAGTQDSRQMSVRHSAEPKFY